jgi:hypothetical protein
MQAATVLQQEGALFFARLAEADLVSGAVDVLFFERGGRHAGELGGALEVVFGQIDETILITAVDTAVLAGEAEPGHFLTLRGCQIAV